MFKFLGLVIVLTAQLY